jgi:hypothetical protein
MPTQTTPPSLKVQLFYNSVQSGQDQTGGWSETYWYPSVNFDSCYTAACALQKLRMAATAHDVAFAGGRITDANHPRKVQVIAPTDANCSPVGQYAEGEGANKTAVLTSIHPDLALLLRQSSVDRDYSLHYFHGVPNTVYDPPQGIKLDDADWVTAFNAYTAALKTSWVMVLGKNPNRLTKAINTITIERLTARKVGRPFFSFVGERPRV